MERKGEAAGVRVYDSYAHHPAEIAGDLEAARAVAGDGRVVVAFQPHLVSRTRIFGPAMGEALGAADEVVVLDVYLAREDADPAVTGRLVADAVPLPPERVALRAPTSRRRPPSWSPAPGPATWCSPSAPAPSPRSARWCSPSWEPRSDEPATARGRDQHRRSGPRLRSRKRFARRQWRRRWLAWRYVVASILLLALVVGQHLAGLLLHRADRQGRRRRRAETSLTRDADPGRGRRARRRAAGPRRPRRDRGPARARWPPSAPSTCRGSGPTRC